MDVQTQSDKILAMPCRHENEFDFQTILTTTANISNEPFMNGTLYCELDLQKLRHHIISLRI